MKINALLLASALLLPAAGAFAQSFAFVAPAADLHELVGAYPGALASAPAAGTVTYFGVETSHDAQHAQFARLRQAFAASRPTIVLFEKPDLGVDSTEAATIARLGESGYARFLAQQHGVRTERLDNPTAEYAYLRARTAAAPLRLYYLLRASQQFRQSTGASKALTQQAMRQLLAGGATFLPGNEAPIGSLAELAAAYRQYCPASGQWWSRPLAPQPTADLLQQLDQDLSAFRSQRLSEKVAAYAQAGERVLVVLDRSHLPAPAAYAATTPASR